MDLVASIGYAGQKFVFLGQDNFAYISGKSICVVGISNGIPREMIWRSETGIGRIVSHPITRRVVIIPEVAEFDIEVIDVSNPSNFTVLKNPSRARVVDAAFTREGDLLYAISGPLDPKVFAWNLRSRSMVFIAELPANFLSISINPADKAKFILSGNEDLYMASIVEIMDISKVKFDKIDLDASVAARLGSGGVQSSSNDGTATSPAKRSTSRRPTAISASRATTRAEL